jgi:hypothetical protein
MNLQNWKVSATSFLVKQNFSPLFIPFCPYLDKQLDSSAACILLVCCLACDPEDDSTFLRNVGGPLSDYKAPHPKRNSVQITKGLDLFFGTT